MNPNLSNDGDVTAFLLEHKIYPDKLDNFDEYPLKYFIQNNMIEAAIVLIDSGLVYLDRKFTIRIGNEYTGTTYHDISYFHIAASIPKQEVLSKLLEKDIIDINCVDSLGKT